VQLAIAIYGLNKILKKKESDFAKWLNDAKGLGIEEINSL